MGLPKAVIPLDGKFMLELTGDDHLHLVESTESYNRVLLHHQRPLDMSMFAIKILEGCIKADSKMKVHIVDYLERYVL